MTPGFDGDSEIINGIDVDHLEDRPDRLEHVAIEETSDGDLRARPFNESDELPPGYLEIDVNLIQYDQVCEFVESATDYDRAIDFSQVPKWPPDGPTATGPPGPPGPHIR